MAAAVETLHSRRTQQMTVTKKGEDGFTLEDDQGGKVDFPHDHAWALSCDQAGGCGKVQVRSSRIGSERCTHCGMPMRGRWVNILEALGVTR